MIAPSATSASKRRPKPRRPSASACSASGISSAPGTLATWMSPAATPRSSSCLSQAVTSSRTMSSLNRLQTTPMRSPSPLRSGTATVIRPRGLDASPSHGPHERVVGRDVLLDLEPESRHARYALGPGEHAHLADAEVAQDLSSDAVQSRIPLPRRAPLARAALDPLQDLRGLRRRFVAPQQDHDTFLVVGDDAHLVLHRVGVAAGIEIEKVERDEWLVHAHEHGPIGVRLALHQRVMQLVHGLVVIHAKAEWPVRRRDRLFCHAFDQILVNRAMGGPVSARAQLAGLERD